MKLSPNEALTHYPANPFGTCTVGLSLPRGKVLSPGSTASSTMWHHNPQCHLGRHMHANCIFQTSQTCCICEVLVLLYHENQSLSLRLSGPNTFNERKKVGLASKASDYLFQRSPS